MTSPDASAPDAGQSADVDRTARTIKGDEPVRSPTLERRQGKIVAVDVANAKVDLTLGGDTVVIPGVSHISNYRPQVDDTVWVDVNGPDLLALDRIGALGPSVIDTAASAEVTTAQTRTSTSYGDLSTVGPSVQVSVSPSGRLLVQVFAWVEAIVDGSAAVGGAMGIALSGANTLSASDSEALIIFLDLICGVAIAGNTTVGASKTAFLSGLNPGLTTITAKYRSIGTGGDPVEFGLRQLWALPL